LESGAPIIKYPVQVSRAPIAILPVPLITPDCTVYIIKKRLKRSHMYQVSFSSWNTTASFVKMDIMDVSAMTKKKA
jgi:hypothetical protein